MKQSLCSNKILIRRQKVLYDLLLFSLTSNYHNYLSTIYALTYTRLKCRFPQLSLQMNLNLKTNGLIMALTGVIAVPMSHTSGMRQQKQRNAAASA